jgi:hypothetical protein
MTKHAAQHAITTYRAQLRTHEAQSEHAIEVAFANAVGAIHDWVDDLVEKMKVQQANDEEVSIPPAYERAFHTAIASHIDHFAAVAQHTVAQQQQIGAHLGQQSAQQLLQASVPEGVHWTFKVVEKA